MERTQFDWQHEYRATPNEYPISANQNHSTYDQFIQLRDTLIFTWKYYNNKASRKLCVWDKGDGTTTNTIEVCLPHYFRQWIQPWWAWDSTKVTTNFLPTPSWDYVIPVPSQLVTDLQLWPLCCMINKDGHYRIMHKEEVLLSSSVEKVYCYVDVYRKDQNNTYKIAYKWWVAVFDWQWSGRLVGNTWYVDFTLWKLFQKMTALGIQERDLLKGDILVLRMKDGTYNPTTWEPTGNNLDIQNDSNYWSIEYLDLPYNI